MHEKLAIPQNYYTGKYLFRSPTHHYHPFYDSNLLDGQGRRLPKVGSSLPIIPMGTFVFVMTGYPIMLRCLLQRQFS
jgi:hypothetical protein